MSNLSFYLVDVFAETKYVGNQLAVFPHSQDLSTAQMQQIAKELNFSETTFVLGGSDRAGYDVRIFTPAQELPFAGHPTLGTAFVIQQVLLGHPVEQVGLNLAVGQIPVTIAYHQHTPEVLWMEQPAPVFGPTLTAAAIAPILSLGLEDLDLRFPIQEVSTGVPFVIVPLKTLDALQRIRVNAEQLAQVLAPLAAKAVFVFCPETRDRDRQFSARMFAPLLGIAEDPATGSANGCFAGYLVRHRYLQTATIQVQVEQGYEIGRPSLLRLEAEEQNGAIAVRVGGKVVLVAKGEFV